MVYSVFLQLSKRLILILKLKENGNNIKSVHKNSFKENTFLNIIFFTEQKQIAVSLDSFEPKRKTITD